MSKRNKFNSGHTEQRRLNDGLDELAAYEDFCNSVLPKLRQAVTAGKGSADIYKMAESAAAARIVTIAMTEKDPKTAMLAIKEILDRSLGKATETVKNVSTYEAMTDDELEALIAAKESALEGDSPKH